MSTRLTFRMAAPSIVISLVLLAVGIVGGWYVRYLQQSTAAHVATDISTIRAAEQLVLSVNEIESELRDYLETNDRSHFDTVPQKCLRTEQSLAEAEGLADDLNEKDLTRKARSGYAAFREQFEELATIKGEKETRAAVRNLVSVSLDQGVLEPASDLLAMEQDLVRKSGNYNQELASWIAIFLLLVGVCGAVAGLVAGFGIARSVSRSIVELYLPIQAASGRLEEIIGPVDVAPAAGIENLDAILRRIADQVGAVVDQLQRNQAKMLRTEQMAALGQLAAGLAHELRNPLTSMKMLIAAAAESGDPGQLNERDLAVLTAETARLEQSIQTFLDFARPPKLQKRCCDLRDDVRQTVDLVTPRGRKQGVVLECNLPERQVIIEADHEQIRQVLLNLVLNAMDAQMGGGSIEIGVAKTFSGEARVPAPGDGDAPPRSWVELSIADRGPGIAPGMIERIFEPYVSTKDTGLGMGLAICRRIVEDHGGAISVANGSDGGAVFTVRLPAFAAIPA
jgi:two-component system sensor histidine kinase HydH